MRVCNVTGCPTIYPDVEGTRCPAHRKQSDRQHWANTRAYNSSGHRKRFRPAVLARDPICVMCNAAQATVADHYPHGRDELILQGLDPDDPQYGRGLCTTCNRRQTAARQPGGWNKRD